MAKGGSRKGAGRPSKAKKAASEAAACRSQTRLDFRSLAPNQLNDTVRPATQESPIRCSKRIAARNKKHHKVPSKALAGIFSKGEASKSNDRHPPNQPAAEQPKSLSQSSKHISNQNKKQHHNAPNKVAAIFNTKGEVTKRQQKRQSPGRQSSDQENSTLQAHAPNQYKKRRTDSSVARPKRGKTKSKMQDKDEKDGNRLLRAYFKMKNPCNPSANELYDESEDEDEDDEDFVSEFDDESDIDEMDSVSNTHVRVRDRYQPPKGSTLEEYLDKRKEVIKLGIKEGKDQKWFVSDFTPTTTGRCDPRRYYCGKVVIYAHDPLKHHSNQIQGDPDGSPAQFSCVHCKKNGTLKGQSWNYRPAHYADSEVWVLHRRYLCSKDKKSSDGSCGCGKTFANFHPLFMEQLPNVVSETFPFIMTTGGQGMHVSMMNQFMVACTKGIMFGAYASMINESKKMKFYQDHSIYMDNLGDRQEQVQKTRKNGYTVPEPDYRPFSAFNTPGEYNGILLKASLVKALFLRVMRTLEDYLQASFQLNLDESESPDHSFKFAKMIMSFVRSGKIWTGTYDSVSLKGMITMNFFCHTKSNDEICAAIKDNKRVHEFTGAPELKRIEGDGGGDASAWVSVYPESLVEKTNPYQPMWNDGLPRARLSEKSIQVFRDVHSLERWASSLSNVLDKWDEPIVYGLDTEQNRDGKTRIIQLCFPRVFYARVVVVDLAAMGILRRAHFQEKLKHFSALLTRKDVIPVAVQISHDVKCLLELGVDRGVNKVVELGNVAKQLEPYHADGFSLQKLSARHLGYYVSKEHQTSDWDCVTDSMIEYAALDAYLHLRLYQEMQNLVILARKDGTLPAHPSLPKLNLGNHVNILFNGQPVGSGTLEFIGGCDGETMKFGDVVVGRGKSIVAISETTQKPSFPTKGYVVLKDDKSSCIHCADKLSRVFEKHAVDGRLLVVWSTSNLALFMDRSKDVEKKDSDVSLLDLCSSDQIILPVRKAADATDKATTGTGTPTDPPSDVFRYADDVVVDTNILPRSRSFLDRFHIFDSFPASRDLEEKAALNVIRRMAFSTVTTFDEDDLSSLLKFFQEKRKIDDLNDIIDDFFFNKEWWYKRVRMYPPPSAESVDNINEVKSIILGSKHLSKFWSPKLDKWFDNLLKICREGKLEEASDCVMFQWVGEDKNGLSLYIRRRGSNRSELLHQKMKIAFGPHGVGAEVGHYLLLWVTYRFNVSTGIRRLNHHKFGIHQLHLIDRIQTRYLQVFGCDVFPRHKNQTEQKTIPGLVSVGIRPLDYDEVFVRKGPCHPSLRGDLRFIATRSGVVCPPMPIAHPKEKAIFNNFVLNVKEKKMSNKHWD